MKFVKNIFLNKQKLYVIFTSVLFSVSFLWSQTSVTPRVTLQDTDCEDQDDMCIWVHPADRSLSTVIAADKAANMLFVYDLNGNTIQALPVSGQPGNIDIRYNFPLAGQQVDIVGYNDRSAERMQFYRIDPATRQLSDAGSFDAGSWPDELYGCALYHSPVSGKFYAVGAGKSSQMRQWELFDTGSGTVGGTELRTWQNGSSGQTEGVVCDDETGHIFAANESHGVYKYDAEPGDPNPTGALVAPTGSNGLVEDAEGVTLYYAANGGGYLIVSSQGNDKYIIYERQAPHNFVKEFTVIGAQSTDGIDVTNVPLSPSFPSGIFTLHNGSNSPYPVLICAYEDLGLQIDTGYWDPRNDSTATAIAGGNRVPSDFALHQNYPNPFNPATTLTFDLPVNQTVSLKVYNLLGQQVAVIAEGYFRAGEHSFRFDASRLPSGIYFYTLTTEKFQKIRQMVLMK